MRRVSLMSEAAKIRTFYWTVILCLLVWVSVLNSQVEEYKYAEIYLRSSIRALQARVLVI